MPASSFYLTGDCRKREFLGIRLDRSLMHNLREKAVANGKDVSTTVREILHEHI